MPKKKSSKRVSDQKRKAIVKGLQAGMTMKQLETKYRVSAPTVWKIKKGQD